jgi:hypothetical protein
MKPELARKVAARLVFFMGLALMILGITFLLGFLEGTSRISVFLSFLCVVIGASCAGMAMKLTRRWLYFFFAAFFLMAALFLFLLALKIIPLAFSQAWPLLSVFAGLALLPAGWRRYGAFRSRYIVSSGAFVVLGCVLLVFSLDVVPFSFTGFIFAWWPLLVVLAGLMLVLISLGSGPHHHHSPGNDGGGGEGKGAP